MAFINYRFIKKQDLNLGKLFFFHFSQGRNADSSRRYNHSILFQSINGISTCKHSYSIVQNK